MSLYPFSDSKKKRLIIHCCHHKTGTIVMHKIFKDVCNELGLKYQYCAQKKLKDDTDLWFENHSKIDFSRINRPIIGSHMIRNPCAIILSAYEYHKKTVEPWAQKKLQSLGGYSYKEVLNRISLEEGLKFEIRNKLFMESSRNTINDIYEWDYNKENFIELKYENLITDFNTTIRNIFKHYGFSGAKLKKIITIANKHNLRNISEKELKKNNHVTNKNLDIYKWTKYFNNEDVINSFYKCYPNDIFDVLGYMERPSTDYAIDKDLIINDLNKEILRLKEKVQNSDNDVKDEDYLPLNEDLNKQINNNEQLPKKSVVNDWIENQLEKNNISDYEKTDIEKNEIEDMIQNIKSNENQQKKNKKNKKGKNKNEKELAKNKESNESINNEGKKVKEDTSIGFKNEINLMPNKQTIFKRRSREIYIEKQK